ncbi:hypothetical protein ACE193_05930 [Bernardetia sp. OM2101]|uniref:hypothetical protein n=1 Tax=Bernardetia sp. OM2101 TaxID=3344876 RepID=UPI0035D08F60
MIKKINKSKKIDFINTKLEISISTLITGLIVTLILVPIVRKIGTMIIKWLARFSKVYQNYLIKEAARTIHTENDNSLGFILILVFISTLFNLSINSSNSILLMSSTSSNSIRFIKQDIKNDLRINEDLQSKLKSITMYVTDTTEVSIPSRDSLLSMDNRLKKQYIFLDSLVKELANEQELVNEQNKNSMTISQKLIYFSMICLVVMILLHSSHRYIQALRANFIRDIDKILCRITQRKKNILVLPTI